MNLPAPFELSSHALLGQEAYDQFVAALQEKSPVSIRINQQKRHSLAGGYRRVPWADTGYYLDERLTFTFDPLFHAGCYYVQEAASMFVEQALRQHLPAAPVVMLDLCAAPGGKSTHLRSLLPEGSLLVANEVIRNRSQILAENLTKWGHPEVVVTNSDPADFAPLQGFFDLILADVPCSGEGMFRKDPHAIEEWSAEQVTICWQRQRRILSDVWGSLRPGGILIYSTCTYNTLENEENVRWLCHEFGAEVLPVSHAAEWQITGNLLPDGDFPVYRFLPHRTAGEGFFLAVVRKPDEAGAVTSATDRFAPKRKVRREPAVPAPLFKEPLAAAAKLLLHPEAYAFSTQGTTISALPRTHLDKLELLSASLRVLQAGITVGEVKGRDLIPHQSLAMSQALRPDCFPTEELTYEQAIAYLRKEAISLSETAPRGYLLLRYQGVPLGFAKNIGNRANNLYPQEWRIRSGYLPEEIRTLL